MTDEEVKNTKFTSDSKVSFDGRIWNLLSIDFTRKEIRMQREMRYGDDVNLIYTATIPWKAVDDIQLPL
jgi:hypothetical protein